MRILFAFLFAATLFTPPAANASDLLFGAQTHSYRVVMRGNGEAIVYGTLRVPNADDEPLDHLRLNLNVTDAKDFVAYQEIAVDRRKFDHQKMAAEVVAPGTYNLQFPLTIDPEGTTKIIFAYRSMSYTDKTLGLYTYEFVTPSVDSRVERMTVSVTTDHDLYLKEDSNSIEYTNDNEAGYADLAAVSDDLALSVRTSNRHANATAIDLQAGESFAVEGAYSEHWWRVHLSRILWTIFLITSAIVAAYFLRKKITWRPGLKSFIAGLLLIITIAFVIDKLSDIPMYYDAY